MEKIFDGVVSMNYMEQVAKMMGVELGEEFTINDSYNSIYKFTKNGLFWRWDERWLPSGITFVRILCGEDEIIKKPILDDAERRYLNNIIKPFRDRVKDIVKHGYDCYEYIEIRFYSENVPMGNINLPYYEKSTMYKGMEVNREYSLEELEL